jgi:hypothetical protein
LKCKDGNGKNQFAAMKRIGVILFSLVLVYGGVASALEKCLSHDGNHEHSVASHDSSSDDPTLEHSGDSSWPFIHCPQAEIRVGPAVQSGSTQFRSHRVTTIHAFSFHEPESLTCRHKLWLDAVFRRTRSSSYPDGVGRHLFFSILLI